MNISEEQQRGYHHYIKYMASIGQPLTVQMIKAFAWSIAKKYKNRKRNFDPDTGPGHNWWSFHKRRVKDVTVRKPDAIDRGRARMANVNVMKQHFDKLRSVMEEHSILDKPDI